MQDIDRSSWQDEVTVRAYDADGNLIPVDMTPAGNDIVDGNTVTAGNSADSISSADGSVLVEIGGPVARIEMALGAAIGAITFSGSVIAFAVVTETVFAWPGRGKLIIDSIFQLDRPVIVAYLIVIVCLFITINLIVDILYAILDPRVRLSDQKA